MIKINNVGMKFNLGVEKDNSLKMIFIRMFDRKKNEKKRLLGFKKCYFSSR